MNAGVHVSFSVLVPLGYMSSSGIAESYSSFIPSFLRNPHTVKGTRYLINTHDKEKTGTE